MNPNREEVLFALALDKPAEKRTVFLDAMCEGDAELRQRLEALLAAHEDKETLMAEHSIIKPRSTLPVQIPSDDEIVGTWIGRYKLREKLGEGGCGVVYVAEQEEPVRRRVALKVIKLGMDTKQVVARFEAERQALAMMDHPNIAKVLDAGTTEAGRPYFVMELVRGIRMTDYCDKHQLDTQARLNLFILVCQAVQHAHQKGIIHRDIKPSNILITLHDGVPVPKVIDFGIAKATEGRLTDLTVYTELHQFIGTPAYMSPEQAEMSGLDIDTRSDIYSLGVLLYELLTGRTPFDAKELVSRGLDEIRRTIREVEPPRPSTRLSTLIQGDMETVAKARGTESLRLKTLVRGDLDWIVMKCLEKDRTRRYETSNGLAADLKRHLNNEPVVARPPSTSYRLQKSWRRNKFAIVSGFTILIALLLGLGIAAAGWREAMGERDNALVARQAEERQRREAQESQKRAEALRQIAEHSERENRLNLYAADITATQQYLEGGNLGAARTLLEKQVPRQGEADLRGWEWRHFWKNSKGDQLYRLEGHSNTVTKVQFLPDDNHLLSLGIRPGELILWDWRARKELRRLQQNLDVASFSVARDGKRVGIAFSSGKLELWDSGISRSMAVCPVRVTAFLFSPVDTKVYVNLENETVSSWDWVTGEQKVLFEGRKTPIEAISEDGLEMVTRESKSHLLWSLNENRLLRTTPPQPDEDGSEALILPDKSGLISLAWGRNPSVLDFRNSDWEDFLPSKEFSLNVQEQIAMSPEANLLATASFNHEVVLWNLGTREVKARLHGHRNEAWTVAISPDRRFIATGGQDRSVLIWSTSPKTQVDTISFRSGYSNPVFSPNGNLLVLRSRDDERPAILDLESAARIATLPDAETALRFNVDGSRLVAVGVDSIRTYDSSTWSLIETHPLDFTLVLKKDTACAETVFVGVDTNSFVHATGLDDGITRLKLRAPNECSIAISPDGRRISIASAQVIGATDIDLWDVATGQLLGRFKGHDRGVTHLEFSSDGKSLASCCWDSTIRIWEVESFRLLQTLKGHKRGTGGGGFSRDGKTFASVNHDRTLKIWNLATSREVASFNLPKAAGVAAFSPDSRFLVAYAWETDGCTVWRAPTWEEIDATENSERARH